jgi:hypothetical protein
MDEVCSGLYGYRRIVDDVVMYDIDSDKEKHDVHVWYFLQRCADKKITLNRDKWVYAKPEVEFAGCVLNADGYRINLKLYQDTVRPTILYWDWLISSQPASWLLSAHF